jgi:hypothetical protein
MEPENKSGYPSGRVERTLELSRQLNDLRQKPWVLIEENQRRTRELIDGFEANESPNEETIKAFKHDMQKAWKRYTRQYGE